MSSQIELIVKGIDMSKALLQLAEQQEWQQFLELTQQRQETLSKLDLQSASVNASQHEEIQQKMTVLMKLNDQIETVCKQQRSEIVDNIKQLNKGKNAKNAYSDITEN